MANMGLKRSLAGDWQNRNSFTISGGSGNGNIEVRLFRNNVTIDETTLIGALTEANFSGYASWNLDAADLNIDDFTTPGEVRVTSDPHNFAHNGGGTSNTIYGAFVSFAGTYFYAWNFPPKTMATGADNFDLVFNFGLSPTDPPAPGAGPSYPTDILALDSFTDTNGTLLSSHTPEVGPAWINNAGALEIQSGVAIDPNTNAGFEISTMDLGVANVRLFLQIVCDTSGGDFSAFGFCARFQDTSNHLYFRIHTPSGEIEIYKVVAGTHTKLGSASITLSNGAKYQLSLHLNGNDIDFTAIGGGSCAHISVTDSAGAGNTKHGLWAYQDTTDWNQAVFDNFIALPG